MPYIRVRPEGLQRMSEMLDRVEKDIEQREEAFSIVSRNLDWQVKREEDIDWQLRCICIELQEEKQKIAEIAEYLRSASVIYEKLEKNLQNEDELYMTKTNRKHHLVQLMSRFTAGFWKCPKIL